MQRARMFVILALCGGLSCIASASDFLPTERECHEASDFIEHAAMSRDNSYSREFLVGRFDDDMRVLAGMDPQKRWFVRSSGATRFLREALIDVFEARRKPKDLAGVFLKSCMVHVLAITPDDL